jgi:hypothetical protein
MLIKLPQQLLEDVDIDIRWTSGPFMGLKLLPPKAKGKRFEQISHSVFEQRGMLVEKPETSDHDRIVNSEKFEIKGSTITKGTDGMFSFLQIRPAQDYQYLVLAAFHFDGTIKYYKMSKSTILEFIAARIFKPQHGGNAGNSGTFCYNGTLEPFKDSFWFEVQVSK